MNEAIQNYLRKTLFWKYCSALILTLFTIVGWSYFLYFVYQDDHIGKYERYTYLIAAAYLLVLLLLNAILYKGISVLAAYLKTENKGMLALYFRMQRYFWMCSSIIILSIFMVIGGYVLFTSF